MRMQWRIFVCYFVLYNGNHMMARVVRTHVVEDDREPESARCGSSTVEVFRPLNLCIRVVLDAQALTNDKTI